MRALVVTPGVPGSARIEHVDEPVVEPGEVLLRTLAVGVCGTDREIDQSRIFGSPPAGAEWLVLGHELLAVVTSGAGAFRGGDLVAATVRRACASCRCSSPDSCLTGEYSERGIRGLHGFASDFVVERPEHLMAIPRELGDLGVLAEPASVVERAIRHAYAIGRRQSWEPTTALVLGAGAIGMLATYVLRLRGLAVTTIARGPETSPKARLAQGSGARYVSTAGTSIGEIVADAGPFDIVLEATGDASAMVAALGAAGRNGVVGLLGVDAGVHEVSLPANVLGVSFVVGNRALFGSVNASDDDWSSAVHDLVAISQRWPDEADRLVGLEVPPDRFREAFEFSGVKAIVRFADTP